MAWTHLRRVHMKLMDLLDQLETAQKLDSLADTSCRQFIYVVRLTVINSSDLHLIPLHCQRQENCSWKGVSVGNIVVVTLMLETHVIFSLIVLATDSFIIVHLLNTSNSVAILAKNISSIIVVLSTFHFDVRSLSKREISYY